mmetsp:Transcript_21308/g.51193  ORF Transcript_21308/g.51193 Transcript_21308/m.51193 type:complete len:273 (+) Transcript_21308:512-1330(+)
MLRARVAASCRAICSCASFSHTAKLPSWCASSSTCSRAQTLTVCRSHAMSCASLAESSLPPASSSATASASSPMVLSFFTKPESNFSSTLPNRSFRSLIVSASTLGGTSGVESSGPCSPPTPAITIFDVFFGAIFSRSSRCRASDDSMRISRRISATGGSSFASSSLRTRSCSLVSIATAFAPSAPAAFACSRFACSKSYSAPSILPERASPAILPSMMTGVGEAKISRSVCAAVCIRFAISCVTAALIASARARTASSGSAVACSSLWRKA